MFLFLFSLLKVFLLVIHVSVMSKFVISSFIFRLLMSLLLKHLGLGETALSLAENSCSAMPQAIESVLKITQQAKCHMIKVQ